MLTQIVWWATIALETLLLVRSAQQRLAAKFPIFYFYLACVLSVDLLRFYCYTVHPGFYQELYWYTEFFSVVVGYGVIFEIYKRSLKNHPGVARLAQKVLLLVLIVTLAEVVAATFSSPSGSWAYATAKLGRDLRYVEVTLWVVMLAVFSRYRIPAGRNLEGLILGYGFFIAVSVVKLVFVFQPGNRFAPFARKLPSAAYLITLAIWCGALWSSHPDPVPPEEDQIERDYKVLVTETRTTLARAITHLVRSVRP